MAAFIHTCVCTPVTLSSSEKNAAKADEEREAAEKGKEEEAAKLEDSNLALGVLEKEAFEVMGVYTVAQEAADDKSKELEGANKELEELKDETSKLKLAEVELLGKVSDFEKALREHNGRTKFWKDEIVKLKQQEEEDEQYDMSDDEEEEGEEGEEEEGEEGEKEKKDDEEVEEGEKEDAMEIDGEAKEEVVKKEVVKKEKADALPTLPAEALAQFDRRDLKNEIETLEKERDNLGKNANMSAIAEYRKKETDYLAKVTELDRITDERNEARKLWDELRRLRLEKFMEGFGVITLKLKEMYQMITLGGDAELELVDSLDPFSEGIVFSVRPPKKSWKNIANLSGGEKTLSSLALVFALHHYKPTPLYVMDEIDAALDFKNVSIVANYIKERTKNAQFIIISLRNNMFELADRLVGIYKTDNSTKSVTIDPKAFGKNKVVEEKPLGGGDVAVALGDRTNKE